MESKKILTNKYCVMFIAVICCLLWGSAFPVLKISYKEMGMLPDDLCGKIIFAGIRFFIASLLILILNILVIKQPLKVSKKIFSQLFLLGVFQTFLQYFFFYNGLANTSGMKAAIISSSSTFFVVLLAHFVFKNDKITFRKVIGLIIGFTGIILVNLGNKSFNFHFSFRGEGFLILSGIVNAFGTILAKKLSKDVHPFLVTSWQMLLGSSLLIAVGSFGAKAHVFVFTPKAWLLLIYLSFLSATAFSLWYSLLKYNKAGEIVLYRFMVPVFGAILSALILPNEMLTFNIVMALVLVSVGITSINYKKS